MVAMKLRPEEKIAQRIIDKYKLELPVDIYGLIQQFADVEEEQLPFDVDAIFLNEGQRPKVILNADKAILENDSRLVTNWGT